MTNQQVEEIKKELKHYRRLIGIQARLKERLDLMFYNLTGVKGVSLEKIRGTIDTSQVEQNKLEKIDEYEDVLMTYEYITNRIKKIQKVLNQMDVLDREMFMLKYLEGHSFDRLAKMNYMSKTGLIYHMNNVLKGLKI